VFISEEGLVAGSVNRAELAAAYAAATDEAVRENLAAVGAEHGMYVEGDKLVDPSTPEQEPEQELEPEPEPDSREDGVHAVGGGWHEIVVDGEVIDKIRGADAAQDAYEAYQEANSGNDQLP